MIEGYGVKAAGKVIAVPAVAAPRSYTPYLLAIPKNQPGDTRRLDCGLIVGALKHFFLQGYPYSKRLYRIPANALPVLRIPLKETWSGISNKTKPRARHCQGLKRCSKKNNIFLPCKFPIQFANIDLKHCIDIASDDTEMIAQEAFRRKCDGQGELGGDT